MLDWKTVWAVCVLCALASVARAEDAIDQLQRSGRVPPELMQRHAHSDFFSDPLGRYLDLLGAGDLRGARAIQADACAVWKSTRAESAFSGKFRVWETDLSLDVVCRVPG
jgi:hypothetical protein